MDIKAFQSTIDSIDNAIWEKSLGVAAVYNVRALNVVYRPYSIISKCSVNCKNGPIAVYVKIYIDYYNEGRTKLIERVVDEFNINKSWYEKFKENDKFKVVKPLFIIPDECLIATKEVCGNNLHQIIANSTHLLSKNRLDEAYNVFYNVGRWQNLKTKIFPNENLKYSIDDLKYYLDIRLNILTSDKRRNFSRTYIQKINDYIDHKKKTIDPNELKVVKCHNDFNLGNIIADMQNRIHVLDFGRSRYDCYLLDISKLYFQLGLYKYKPQFSNASIKKLQDALLKGFESKEIKDSNVFKLMMIRNIVTHLTNVTQFWKNSFLIRIYNKYVYINELQLLNELLED